MLEHIARQDTQSEMVACTAPLRSGNLMAIGVVTIFAGLERGQDTRAFKCGELTLISTMLYYECVMIQPAIRLTSRMSFRSCLRNSSGENNHMKKLACLGFVISFAAISGTAFAQAQISVTFANAFPIEVLVSCNGGQWAEIHSGERGTVMVHAHENQPVQCVAMHDGRPVWQGHLDINHDQYDYHVTLRDAHGH